MSILKIVEIAQCSICNDDYSKTVYNKKYCSKKCGIKAQPDRTSYRKQYNNENRKMRARHHLLSKYGLTEEDYNQMFTEQSGCCKICDTHQSEFTKRLYVDHCHNTGKVRGLLCHQCNSGIGMLKDNPDLVLKAAAYLKENL